MTTQPADTACDLFSFPNGLEFDLDEGWIKIVSRQFPGSPGRASGELIQNTVDAYPAGTDFADRIIRIETEPQRIAIIDWGEGLSAERLKLLATLGGTDKEDDPSKIGRFGIGFFSIFHPELKTQSVRVVTRSDEGKTVELVFRVEDPNRRPVITAQIVQEVPEFSTRIEIAFNDPFSVVACLRSARSCLEYYPCSVTIDGERYESIWDSAKDRRGGVEFAEDACQGFIEPSYGPTWVTLLCKFERLGESPIGRLVTSKTDYHGDLRDLKRRNVPYFDQAHVVLNSNALNVTISRDGYWLDGNYERMIGSLARGAMPYLDRLLDQRPRAQADELIVANHYTLAKPIKAWLCSEYDGEPNSTQGKEDAVVARLAEAPVYRLSGHPGRYSLADINRMRTPGLPVFYSPREMNVRWLAGNFSHDFVVIPPDTRMGGGAPDLHQHVFESVFGDAVDLDSIRYDKPAIARLVERGIATRDALKPKVVTLREAAMTKEEKVFLKEVNEVLEHPAVATAVTKNLFVKARWIRAVYFHVVSSDTKIAVGLLDGSGKVADPQTHRRRRSLRIGVDRDHPTIRHLVNSSNPHRAYFALTYISHDLPKAQDQLVPYSPGYHFAKRMLGADIRRGLIESLLPGENKKGVTIPAA